MYLQNLALKNFRVFSDLDITFKDGINIISGNNGQGKTSILESIHFLALTRSFKSSSDKNAIKYEEDFFNINGKINLDEGKSIQVNISCTHDNNKQIYLQKKRVDRFSKYIGTIPCVILTLEDMKLSTGYPSNRRAFLDILLSQISPVYLKNLKTYKKVVQQRNKLLSEDNNQNFKSQIQAWNEQLVEYGCSVIKERLKFIKFLNEKINEYYYQFTDKNENLSVSYNPSFDFETIEIDDDKIKLKFLEKIGKVNLREREKKYTLIGPHRDDVEFLKSNKSFKEYGSQGENKTLIIVLKILEWLYVTKENKRSPLMLLDDIFGELDISRIKGLLNFLEHIGQSFITTTTKTKFAELTNRHDIYLNNTKVAYG